MVDILKYVSHFSVRNVTILKTFYTRFVRFCEEMFEWYRMKCCTIDLCKIEIPFMKVSLHFCSYSILKQRFFDIKNSISVFCRQEIPVVTYTKKKVEVNFRKSFKNVFLSS